MGLLDELHSEVARIRDDEARRSRELKAQEAFYEDYLRPVMQRAQKYFDEVVESLNIITPEIHVYYPLDPSRPKGISLRQAEYYFRSDNAMHPGQIDVLAHCGLVEPHEFYVPTREGAEKHSDYLQSCQFPHHRKNKLDKLHNICGATFLLEGPMKVHIRFLADAAEKCVYIQLRNLESQPVKRYKFAPERVDEKLLERLASMLIRKESNLVEVEVCQDFRGELRRRIEEEKRAKERDLAAAFAELEADKLKTEEAKLLKRARNAVSKGHIELRKMVSKTAAVGRSRHH